MKIQVFNKQRSLSLSKVNIKKVVSFFLKKENVQADDVSIYLVNQEKICQLHKQFFDDPSVTDCITFPIDEPSYQKKDTYVILGEIFICPKTAIDYAKIKKIDPYEEVLLYLVHGLLHLIRYDDQTQKQLKIMRKKEKYYMQLIKQQGWSLHP